MFEGASKLKLPNWPWVGLFLSALYLLLIFSLPCLGGGNCYQQADTRQQYGQSRQPLTIVTPQAMSANAKQHAKPCENPPSGCAIVWTAWVWDAGGRYLAKIRDEPVALFTALLFVSTGLLWWVTQQTLRHSERASERQLRAYVVIRRICCDGILSADTSMSGKIKNCGQTPAYQLRVRTRIAVSGYPLSAPLQSRLVSINGPTTLGPGQSITIGYALGHWASHLTDIRDGRSAIYFYGEITYVDAFGQDRVTKFRTHYNKHSLEDRYFRYSEEGNESD